MSQREKATLESHLNSYKQERAIIEQRFERGRQQILNLMMTSPPTSERARNMLTSMTELTNQYRWELGQINSKIRDVEEALRSYF